MAPTRQARTLTASESRTRLGGVETRELSVDGDGPPLLLLHGFADSADTWQPLLGLLGAAGRAAAAIDLAGFGAAEPAAIGELLPQWDAMAAEAVEQLSERHGGAEVLVAGNSLGGCLAMRAAESQALPIAGVVPIAPAGLDMARWFPIIEGERLIKLLTRSPLPIPELLVREIVGRVYVGLTFADPGRARPETVAAFTRHLGTVARTSEILATGRRLLPELERPYRLERIACPLLLVWGDRDRMVFPTGAERVLRTVPYADIEVLAGCGHCPQVEVPERLAEILLAFPEDLEQD